MALRQSMIYLALLLLLAGCGAGQESGQPDLTLAPATEIATQPTQPAATATEAIPPTTAADLPTSVPTAQPDLPDLPTATAQPTQAPPSAEAGLIYVVSDGALVAYDLAAETANDTGIAAPVAFRISPDGRYAALINGDPQNSQGSLTIAGLNGQQSSEVAPTGASDDLAWAPDSSALAYVANGSGRQLYPVSCSRGSEIWVYELGSGEQRKIGDGCNPAWSPDSKRIAYVGVADILDAPENSLYLVNRAGENRWSPLSGTVEEADFPAPRSTFYQPFWSAEGQHVFVFAHFSEFAETSWNSIEMVDSFRGTVEPIGIVWDIDGKTMRLGPDHERIVFASSGAKGTTSINVFTLLGEEHSWSAPWQQGQPVMLRSTEEASLEYVHLAAWSPDGSQLAVLHCASQNAPLGICAPGTTGDLRLMEPAAGTLTEPLLDNVDISAGIDWAPR